MYDEGKNGICKDPFPFETDVQVQLIGKDCRSPLENVWSGNGMMFVMEKVQLISLYTMSQNPNMTHLNISKTVVLPPLWVRCDSSDPQHTCWLGAEPLRTGDKIAGMKFHMVTCNADKTCFANLEELKKAHKIRHHSSTVTTKGFAQYELFRTTSLEDTLIESESNIYVDIAWNTVDKILQIPPLTSAATLNTILAPGDPRSPVYQLHRELQFLLVLSEGLKTGISDWPEPVEAKTAVELVRELLDEGQCDTPEEDSSIKSFFKERGDLDFAEQLWCTMRKSVTSYQDLVECFTLISLECGKIQPWIHQGSSSLLSKLIQQSYRGTMEAVSLTGVTPIKMLLELGLDKMKKDYVSCFIDYFIDTSVDLQEQVHRVQKLHHMLEIVVSCRLLLKFKHENLFPLTQSCIKYYKENPLNEKHVFQLPVRPTLVSGIYQNDQPQIWRVEISSGHGQKEVKTVWQICVTCPAEHMTSSSLGNSEERMYFITMANCSQVSFT
uniref:Protein zwilch n=1 Tax=Sphenodon punctatus TaxID=8508 RepID=A0A8D0HCZ0_SPHPU